MGSTDNSIQVAKKFNPILKHFSLPMTQDQAWKEAVSYASHQWIFYLHPFEMIGEESKDLMRELVEKSVDGYLCTIRHYTNDSSVPGWKKVLTEFPFTGYYETQVVRLFRNGEDLKRNIQTAPIIIHQFPEWNRTQILPTLLRDDPNTLVAYGLEAQKKQNVEKAVAAYQKALSIQPTHLNASINLSFTLIAMKDYERALSVIEQSLKYHPFNPSLLNNKTTIALFQNNVEVAQTLAEKVLVREPSNFNATMNLSYCNIKLENFPKAIALYKQCVSINPKSVEARMNLALAFLKANENDNAILALKGLLEVAPKHEGAKQLLTQIKTY